MTATLSTYILYPCFQPTGHGCVRISLTKSSIAHSLFFLERLVCPNSMRSPPPVADDVMGLVVFPGNARMFTNIKEVRMSLGLMGARTAQLRRFPLPAITCAFLKVLSHCRSSWTACIVREHQGNTRSDPCHMAAATTCMEDVVVRQHALQTSRRFPVICLLRVRGPSCPIVSVV